MLPLKWAVVFALSGIAMLPLGCMSGVQTPPPEAFLALGRVSGPESDLAVEGESSTEPALEENLAKWREKFSANARQLRSLSWNIRVRYRVPGAYSLHLLYRASADVNGDVAVTEVSRRTEQAQGVSRTTEAPPPGDAEYRQAYLTSALARAYTFPQPGAMENFLLPGNVEEHSPGGVITLRTLDFLMPGDSIEARLPPVAFEPEALTFTAMLDGLSVTGTTKFRKLPDGMFYPDAVTLSFPDSNITVLVENFGFRTQPR